MNCLTKVLTAITLSVGTAQASTLDKHVDKLLTEHQLPGMVLSIKHQGKVIHHKAHGVVNVDGSTAVKEDDIFRIYSMSKPITAVALLQLVDQGRVSLDDDIRAFLPQFEPFVVDGKPQVVAVHHLLTHTAGFGYGGGLKNWIDIRYLLANPLSRSNTLDEMVDDIASIDLKFSPGEKFEYSIASDLQGAIIESVTGEPLDQYLKQNIFTPLNMVDTGFYVNQHWASRLVDMYEYDATTFEEAYLFNKEKILLVEEADDSDYLTKPTLISGGGGLVSTALDYSNFVTMLMNQGEFEGKQILSKGLVVKMLSSHTQGLDTHFMPRVYQGVGFGYGIGVKERSGDARKQGTFFWGGMGGTVFWGDPQSELQVVAMMQVEDGWVALEKWLIEHVYPLIENDDAIVATSE